MFFCCRSFRRGSVCRGPSSSCACWRTHHPCRTPASDSSCRWHSESVPRAEPSPAMSFTASGAPAGFSASGSGVAFSGPTAFRPPLSAGLTVAPGVRISTPMEFPPDGAAVGAAPCTLVTADDAPVGALAAGTSWSCKRSCRRGRSGRGGRCSRRSSVWRRVRNG